MKNQPLNEIKEVENSDDSSSDYSFNKNLD